MGRTIIVLKQKRKEAMASVFKRGGKKAKGHYYASLPPQSALILETFGDSWSIIDSSLLLPSDGMLLN